tara:strand:+ start:669 stop:1337 length:669 start_codon:yes stop_codon:yes gene_type:complete
MNFYRFILDEIDANRTFSLIRFGDGELQCIINTSTGYGGGNADGDPYLPKLGEYLKKMILNPTRADSFHYCLNGEYFKGEVGKDLRKKGSWNDKIKWQDAYVFIEALLDNKLDEFISRLNKNHSVLVGAKYMHKVDIDFDDKIEIAQRASFGESGRVIKELDEILSEEKKSIVVFTAGMSANVFVNEAFKKWGTQHTFIDLGSVLDSMVESRIHRSYFSQLK